MSTQALVPPDEWFDHPIVKRVQDRLPEGATALDLLSSLSDTLNDLEDRFPSLTFDQILEGGTNPHPWQIGQRLASLGVSEADIDLICDRQPAVRGSANRAQYTVKDFEAARSGHTGAELHRMGWTEMRAREVSRFTQNVSGNELKWARQVLDEGKPITAVANKVEGIGRYSVRVAVGKVMYRRWLGVSDTENVRREM